MIEVIDNHSVRTDLLTGGPVLDAGCRGFRFAKWFAEKGHQVIALDPDKSANPFDFYAANPDDEDFHFQWRQLALVGKKQHYRLMHTDDPEARYLSHYSSVEGDLVDTALITELGITHWDVVKLNIEGSEYDVLDTWPGNIANQIVVSFHEHCSHARRGRDECDRIINKLEQWYIPVVKEWDERYCAGYNYWDVLLVSKELVG